MNRYYVEKENKTAREQGMEFFIQKKNGPEDVTYAHLHPSLEILYMIEGVFDVIADGQTERAKPGDLIILRANMVHSIRLVVCDSPDENSQHKGKYCVLKIPPTLLFLIFSGRSQLKCSMPFLTKQPNTKYHYQKSVLPPEIPGLFDKMMQELAVNDELLYISERIYASSLLLTIIRTLPEFASTALADDGINNHTLPLILDILSYINENYADDVKPGFCAEYIHVSYSYFARIFRSVTGKTFSEYLTSVRLAKAQELLGSTDLPVTGVALACGYNNVSYFISEYRTAFGQTPGKARKTSTIC